MIPKGEYSPLGKAFDKQVKAIEEQGQKQVATIQDIPGGPRGLVMPKTPVQILKVLSRN